MSRLWLACAVLVACGGESSGKLDVGGGVEECDLALDALEGRTFVELEAQPDGTNKENPMARMKFTKGESGLEARYTVKSISDVYTYYCDAPEGEGDDLEMYCAEKEKPVDWCQALEVHEEGSCNRKKLRKLGIKRASDDDIKAAIKEARANVAKAKKEGGRPWEMFKLNNNNLGNKLQGRLYIEVDAKRCRLSVADMYFTVHNGDKVEDTNPVGKNPFVESKDTLMFEHCTEGRNIVADLNEAEPPKDPSEIPATRMHEYGKPVHYFYFGEKEAKAEEGCTYTADTWVNWKPVGKDISITPEESGQLLWRGSHTYAEGDTISVSGKDAALFEMVRYKACNGGEKETISTTCNVFVF